jgi:hypothetical protein
MNEIDQFLIWEDASSYVGEEKLLKEIDDLFFSFSGFASVEVSERSYERVYVDGYLKLYPSDVDELKKGMTVSYSSSLINPYMSINGESREELFQKFLVFDDELLIGKEVRMGENAFKYPADVYIKQDDLHQLCRTIGIHPGESVQHKSRQDLSMEPADAEQEKEKLIGVLACMLAMNSDLESSLHSEQHLSEIIIDDLFTMMSGLGIEMDGRKKFLYERLITDGVKSVLED